MGLNIRHNMMAQMAQRNLGATYSKMSESINSLSSGLRVNSADDDAAGLAVREEMRANIAALDQGTRNANDAISMLQTFDGAAQVIDEKLVRMKELAEQASTGTYDSDQLEIMNDEFQKMADEIDRIAESTEFNGIKGLNQSGDISIHFGPGNDADEDYYDVGQQNMKASGSGQEITAFADSDGTDDQISVADTSAFSVGQAVQINDDGSSAQTLYVQNVGSGTITVDKASGDSPDLSSYTTGENAVVEPLGGGSSVDDVGNLPTGSAKESAWVGVSDTSKFEVGDTVTLATNNSTDGAPVEDTGLAVASVDENSGQILLDGNISQDYTNASTSNTYVTKEEGGTGTGLQLSGTDITTQSNARDALETINEAIQTKDKARAHFGAMMNRLKNTVRAQNIQREKLQAAEAQISDVDVAKETAQLSRNRVLAQAGISMLSQANSIPQMAQSLLRG